jgi:Undecaprenyl-phosphate glucose phosphotransferase
MLCVFFFEEKSTYFWSNKKYLPVVLIFNLVWLLAANTSALYDGVLNKDSVKMLRGLIKAFLFYVVFMSVALLIISVQANFIKSRYFLSSISLFGVLLALWKLIFLNIRKNERASLIEIRSVIIIGCGKIGYDLHNFFVSHPDAGYRNVGFFDDAPTHLPDKKFHLGDIKHCIDYAVKNKIREIFCTLSVADSPLIAQLMNNADKHLIRFKYIPDYYDLKRPTNMQIWGHIPIISVRPEPLENILNRAVKRLFDCIFALLVIVFVFIWLFPIIALLIVLESNGPVFFIQTRSGRYNKPFKCYKFRSMVVNNDSNEKQATRNDRRVTKVGAFLRKTSLDELPQFFNVLIGNMSVVGPRPHMLKHTSEYAELIDQFMVRHFVKPGITGWAQIKGLRGETKTVEAMLDRVEADVWYLENWSFLLDLKIIFLTIRNAVKGEENAF